MSRDLSLAGSLRSRWLVSIVALCVGCVAARARADDALSYRFRGIDTAVYELTITADHVDKLRTHAGYLVYKVASRDTSNGQLTLNYAIALRESERARNDAGEPPRAGVPAVGQGPGAAEVVIDRFGSVLRTNRAVDEAQLPYLLGFQWELLLKPLDARGERSWESQRDLLLSETVPGAPAKPSAEQLRQLLEDFQRPRDPFDPIRSHRPSYFRPPMGPRFGPRFGPRSPFNDPPQPQPQPPENRIDRSAQEFVTYTETARRGGLVMIHEDYDLEVNEKSGDVPMAQIMGRGDLEFDNSAGLLSAYQTKWALVFTRGNTTTRYPVVINARLLREQDPAKVRADPKAVTGRADPKTATERAVNDADTQRLAHLEALRNRTDDVPAGATKSQVVGGKGGMPFTSVDPKRRPVIGFRVVLTDWADNQQLRKVTPLYEPPSDAGKDTVVLARDGYAVRAVRLNGHEYTHAIKVTFARLKDDKLDASDSYESVWIGDPLNEPDTDLDGKGDIVIGVYGKQGMNLDGLGLVFRGEPPEPAPLSAEAKEQVKAIEAAWRYREGKATDLLPRMSGRSTLNADETVSLNRRQRIQSMDRFKPPVAFRVVAMTDGQDFRFAHAADYIIFNWEMNPDEFRIDGGPANGRHKPGAGRIAANRWVGIELVVLPNEFVIYVDGQERFRHEGDFSQIDKPLTITSHRGVLKIKSVEVVR